MQATLTFLGTGTSMGVPTLGCSCPVCTSATAPGGDPRNRRTRPSLRLDYAGRTVLIDTGPDFHAQAIRDGLTRVDAVLYTHPHADHILGMDDLRPLTFRSPHPLPLYADEATAAKLESIFAYTFVNENRYPTSARVTLHRIASAPGAEIDLFGACFQRIPVTHGRQQITGYRFGSASSSTRCARSPTPATPICKSPSTT
jgi:phosphoribosyl 1,2-cyclic phosphate phosphodiesterase